MQFILDGIIGGILMSLFSFFIIKSGQNKKYEDNISIFGFLWAAPLIYIYMIYVLYNNSNKNKMLLKRFILHASLGTFISILFFSFTIFLINQKYNINTIYLFNFLFISIILYIYLRFQLYKL